MKHANQGAIQRLPFFGSLKVIKSLPREFLLLDLFSKYESASKADPTNSERHLEVSIRLADHSRPQPTLPIKLTSYYFYIVFFSRRSTHPNSGNNFISMLIVVLFPVFILAPTLSSDRIALASKNSFQ